MVDPTNPNRIWIGSVGGGVWHSDDRAANLYPADDFMANLAICCMVMDPTDPSTIYVGTGEGFYNLDAIRGAGVFRSPKSPDGKWELLSNSDQPAMLYLDRLAISHDGKILLAAGQNGKPEGEHQTGIFRSAQPDRADWTNTCNPNVCDQDVTDLQFHPLDSSMAIASGYGRAWYSTDGGKSWQLATGGDQWAGRVEVTYAKKIPSIVYALVDSNGGEIWRSTDGGRSYTKRATSLSIPEASILGAQGWYDNSIWAGDPTNADILVAGGVNLWRSIDGGNTLTDISDWRADRSVHADHHVIIADPHYNGTTNKTMYFGNDGGIYRANDILSVGSDPDRASGWESLNQTYASTQFYGGAGNSTGAIVGGAQDNGTLEMDAGAGIDAWGVMSEGDGGFCFAHPTDTKLFFGEYIDIDLVRSHDGGKASEDLSGIIRWRADGTADWKPAPYSIPDAQAAINGHLDYTYSTANFIAPFALDPNNPKRIFAGGAQLWRTDNADAVVDDNKGPEWMGVKSVLPGDSPDRLISAVAVARGNSNIVWVAHNSGRVFKTDGGALPTPAWEEIDKHIPSKLPRGRMCTRIVFDKNPAVVYLTFGGYSKDNIWKTTDGGSSWTSLHANLPAMPIFTLTIHPADPRTLYIGTELGLFSSSDGGASWSPTNTGPANCSVQDLFWTGNTLVAATHGRGMFKIDLSRSTH